MASMNSEDKKPEKYEAAEGQDHLILPTDDVQKPSENYAPEGYDSPEEYLKCVREDHENDISADNENRVEAVDDKLFAIGEQWDPNVLQHRKGLPCLTINQIPQFTAQLVGDWRQQRNSVRVIPAEDGDVDVADLRSDLIRSIETQSRADRVYDSAFESTVTCGEGAFRISVEYARNDVFNQSIFIRPIEDCHSVVWDHLSVDPTGADARHCTVEDTILRKEFERRWPDADPSDLGSTQYRAMSRTGWVDAKTVKVVEHWRMIERDRLIGLFQDGSLHIIDGDAYAELEKTHGPVVRSRLAPVSYAQMHLVTGWKILAGPFEWQLDRLPIIRMVGRTLSVEGQRFRYGLVRFMKDPSRLRNFWRSVAAEQLGYAPKAQWIAPESAVAGREEAFRKAHFSRDPLIIYNDDAVAPPERLNPPAPQMALLNEAQVNTQDMKDVTGIHDASLGIKSNETSGRAIMARQKEGDIASLTFYDNGNASVLEGGSVINQLIGQIYDGTRIIRLVGQDGAIKLTKINDPNDPQSPNLAIGKYDTVLDTGASYTTKRAEAADAMMQAIQVFPELMQIAGDLVVKAQDWPGAQELAERLKKTIPPQLLTPEEQQQMGADPNAQQAQQVQQAAQQAQAAMQEQQSQIAALTQQLQDKSRELDIRAYEAETKRMAATADHQIDKAGLLHKVIDSGFNYQLRTDARQNNQSPSVAKPNG